jgi:hypothetical protein
MLVLRERKRREIVSVFHRRLEGFAGPPRGGGIGDGIVGWAWSLL